MRKEIPIENQGWSHHLLRRPRMRPTDSARSWLDLFFKILAKKCSRAVPTVSGNYHRPARSRQLLQNTDWPHYFTICLRRSCTHRTPWNKRRYPGWLVAGWSGRAVLLRSIQGWQPAQSSGVGRHRSLPVQPCRLESPWAEELQLRRHECWIQHLYGRSEGV